MKMSPMHLSRTKAWITIATCSGLMCMAGWWVTGFFYAQVARAELQTSAQEYAKVIREQLSTIETRLLLDVAPIASKSQLGKSNQFSLLTKEFPEIVRLEVRDENGSLLDEASSTEFHAPARTLSPGLFTNFSAANISRRVIYSAPYELKAASNFNQDQASTFLMDVFIPTAQRAKTMVVATLKPNTWMSEKITERSVLIDKNQQYSILDTNQNLISSTTLPDRAQVSDVQAITPIDLNNGVIYLSAKRIESKDTFFNLYRLLAAMLAGSAAFATGMLIRSTLIRKSTQEKLKKLQEKVESDSRAVTLGEMSTAIAHELNQPLGAIENFAAGCERLLKKDTSRIGDVLTALEHIRSEASRGAQVIKSIREFVKRDNEQHELVSVQGVLNGLMPLLEIQAKSNHTKLKLECHKDIHLNTNRALFEQVLLNLARNGFESMEDKPSSSRELTIKASTSIESSQKTALITVEDNGSGIDDNIEKKLFKPFASTKPHGMGIGLSLCQSIVERQGGSIRWERREQGGTRFTLILPKIQIEA